MKMQTISMSWSWWRYQMETFSALLAYCDGNSPVSGEFPSQRPVTRSFDVFFDLRLNKTLSKQAWGWWCETLSRQLWRHCNDVIIEWPYHWFRCPIIHWPTHLKCMSIDPSHKSCNAMTNIPQCTVSFQKFPHVCIVPLQSGALWDMGLVHFGIRATGL